MEINRASAYEILNELIECLRETTPDIEEKEHLITARDYIKASYRNRIRPDDSTNLILGGLEKSLIRGWIGEKEPDFNSVWNKTRYQYGESELENVRLGWELYAHSSGIKLSNGILWLENDKLERVSAGMVNYKVSEKKNVDNNVVVEAHLAWDAYKKANLRNERGSCLSYSEVIVTQVSGDE